MPQDVSTGHSGGPMSTTVMRLKDCPELEYLHTDKPYPRGELQFRGPIAIKGYFKNEEKTKELFDDEGFINSGDIALVYPNGGVKIIDRVKNIFKLAQGEYIAPEKIENVYCQCPGVLQIFVHGDSLQAFLVGVLVPNPDFAKTWATGMGHQNMDLK